MPLLSIFTTVGYQYFRSEIEALLVKDVFAKICMKDIENDPKLKIICDIIETYDLNSYSRAIKSLLISNEISMEQKIFLLKIKLDYIINSECGGKRRFFIMVIIAALLSFTVSGVDGLSIILQALSKEIIKALVKKGSNIPVDYLDD